MKSPPRFGEQDPVAVIDRVPPDTHLSDLPGMFDQWTDREFEAAFVNTVISVIAEMRLSGVVPSDKEIAIALTYVKTRYRAIIERMSLNPLCIRARGEEVPTSRLAEFTVRVIRRLPLSMSNRSIAPFFGISYQTVNRVRRGVAWRHVPMTKPLPERPQPRSRKTSPPLSPHAAKAGEALRNMRSRYWKH